MFRRNLVSSTVTLRRQRSRTIAGLIAVTITASVGWAAAPAAIAETAADVSAISPMAVPTPKANEAVITVRVGGTRLPDGTVAGVEGVNLALYAAGTATSGTSAPTQGVPGARYDASWSWANCTSDAAGDCSFVIPIRTGAPDVSGAAPNTRFWVQQVGASPTGWYSNPTVRLGGFGSTPEFVWGYRFRTGATLVAGGTYTSIAPLLAPAISADWNLSTEPNRGFMRNREDTNTEGGMGSNIGRTTGIWNQSRTNNDVPDQCGIDVALVVDTSGSLGEAGMADEKLAMDTFVTSFRGTPTTMSLFSFSTSSPGTGAGNFPTPLPVATSAQAAIFQAQYAGWAAGGGTNWDRGLAAAANSGHSYDLVVMLTDGNPTVIGATPDAGASAFNSYQDLDAGIFSANQLKQAGSRVVVLGVGPAVTAASEYNLRAVSGQTKGADYFNVDTFADAAVIMSNLAKANCQGGIEVQKLIVPAGGTVANATPAPAGWNFAASTTATGVAVTAPTSTVTGGDGIVTFGLSFSNPTTSGAVQILETQQAGYELLPVGSGAGARNAVCINKETGATVAVVDAGTAATPGFTVTGTAGALVTCKIYNRVVPPASLATVKTATTIAGLPVSPGATVTAGQVIGYTITTTNTGGVPGTTTLTETVPVGSTYTGTGQGWSCATGSVAGTTCTQTVTVPAGGAVSTPFTVTVVSPIPAGLTQIRNVVTSSGGSCATCETTNPVPNLTVVKTSDPAPGTAVRPAADGVDPTTITYTLTFTNSGGAAAQVARIDDLTDVLDDADWLVDPASPNPLVSAPSVTATFDSAGKLLVLGGSVPAGATITVTYHVTLKPLVDGAPQGNGRLFNVVVLPGETPPTECVPETQLCTVHPVVQYRVEKKASPASSSSVMPGDVITYTVTATSDVGTATNVVLTDVLTDVLDDADFVPGSATLVINGAAAIAVPDPTTVPPGGPTLVTAPFTLPALTTATLTYQVTVHEDAWNATLRNVVTGDGEIPPATCAPEPSSSRPTVAFAPAPEVCETTHTVPALLHIQKVGRDGSGAVIPMPGSEFALHLDAGGTMGAVLATPAITAVAGQVGLFEVRGILPGTYWLVETRAPAGFSLLAQPVKVVVSASGVITAPGADDGGTISVAGDTVTVHDVPIFDLPEAGGSGDAPITLAGLALIGLAGVLLVRRRGGAARHTA